MATSTTTRNPSRLTPAAFMADAAACGVHFLVHPDGSLWTQLPVPLQGMDERDVAAAFADRRLRAGVKRIAARRCAAAWERHQSARP